MSATITTNTNTTNTTTTNTTITTYTVFYCEKHDQGAIVRGLYDVPPTWLPLVACGNCALSAWEKHGTIINGMHTNLSTNLRSQAFYDICAGGWKTDFFCQCVYDEEGNPNTLSCEVQTQLRELYTC
jgi:hypothetical protein